jgi:hypothetical protein
MNSDQKLKEAQLRATADRQLARDVPNTRARDILLDQIASAPSARAYILGNAPAPDAAELVGDLWGTAAGQNLRDVLDSNDEAVEGQTDRAAEIERINAISDPALKMTAARRAGLYS